MRPSVQVVNEQRTETLSAIVVALRDCAGAIAKLAAALEAATAGTSHPSETAGAWPTLMSTSMAARYCGYKSSSAIRKAHLEGRLMPAGRRGGIGSWMWARTELDAFLGGRSRGGTSAVAAPATQDDGGAGKRPDVSVDRPGIPSTASAQIRQRKLSPESQAALERIRARATTPRKV
jgi:hypothetical protein